MLYLFILRKSAKNTADIHLLYVFRRTRLLQRKALYRAPIFAVKFHGILLVRAKNCIAQ